jgi:hypothetical protein
MRSLSGMIISWLLVVDVVNAIIAKVGVLHQRETIA